MLRRLSLLVVAILLSVSTQASAQVAAISFNNNSAQLGYGFAIGGSNYGRMQFRTDFLYSTNESYLLSPGILLTDEVGSKAKGLKAGLGAKLYGGSIQNKEFEFLALGIGGMMRYALPMNRRVFFGADGYIAPNILSAGADLLYEVSLKAGFDVLPTASVFLEYRRYFLDAKNDSGTFEDGARVGMELNF
ncbi:MAG TPA: hypothetical protein ENK06_07610 [Gammaproteobacteria bacterium]|nr:hypothetical protein [Gammaproteobacteria bacterium]